MVDQSAKVRDTKWYIGMDEQNKTEPKRSLGRAIREVRIADVEQNSVIVELGDTERARLELLHEALVDVASELPEDLDMLTFQIVPGRKPPLLG